MPSACELLLGAVIVVGHNVYHVIPNEVPLLVVLGLLSARLRDGSWAVLGFKRPASWRRIVLLAAALRIVLGEFVIQPIATEFWPPIVASSVLEGARGSAGASLSALLFVWTFAAVGEEIAYRGYLILRGADLGNRSPTAYWSGMVFASVLFGVGHFYKGPAGIVDSTFAGLVLGSAYLLCGRNLWVSILAHGPH
jgi:hypothetical protein